MNHIVLPHGLDRFGGIDTPFGPLAMVRAVEVFEAAGFECWVPSLGGDNVVNAGRIKDVIDGIPASDNVSIVGHSMGTLSGRHYLKYLGGAERVSAYVAIDGPQYGTWKALNPITWCPQITPPAAFIKNLNKEPPTPGASLYVQLTVEYTQLLPGVRWKSLVREGIDHRNVVADTATLEMIVRILQGNVSELTSN